MISQDQNKALLTVGNAALTNPNWTEYANYCLAREKGLRKMAFNYLEDFLASAAKWTIDQKIEFIKFLFPFFEIIEDADYGPFPQPLSERLAKPTLEYWCENESKDERPFRWLGIYYRSEEHLLRAIELNPNDDTSRQQLLNCWLYNIYYSIHHLPEGYIGEPLEDLELAEKAIKQIEQLTDSDLKDKWKKRLDANLEFIYNYIEWKKSGNPHFEQWGNDNNKKVSYGTKTYYYHK
jgi:hypothetical protein